MILEWFAVYIIYAVAIYLVLHLIWIFVSISFQHAFYFIINNPVETVRTIGISCLICLIGYLYELVKNNFIEVKLEFVLENSFFGILIYLIYVVLKFKFFE